MACEDVRIQFLWEQSFVVVPEGGSNCHILWAEEIEEAHNIFLDFFFLGGEVAEEVGVEFYWIHDGLLIGHTERGWFSAGNGPFQEGEVALDQKVSECFINDVEVFDDGHLGVHSAEKGGDDVLFSEVPERKLAGLFFCQNFDESDFQGGGVELLGEEEGKNSRKRADRLQQLMFALLADETILFSKFFHNFEEVDCFQEIGLFVVWESHVEDIFLEMGNPLRIFW